MFWNLDKKPRDIFFITKISWDWWLKIPCIYGICWALGQATDTGHCVCWALGQATDTGHYVNVWDISNLESIGQAADVGHFVFIWN